MNDHILDILTVIGRADKAINSLRGILEGIKIDEVVTDQEIKSVICNHPMG